MTTKINYSFTIDINPLEGINFEFAPSVISPVQKLHEKIAKVPTAFLDKLHPNSSDAQPFVEYVDEGIWKSRITFHKDPSYSVLLNKRKAEAAIPFPNLDSLCAAELQRRFPNYTVITGAKAYFKDKFPNLTRLVMGADQFYKEFTVKEINKFKKQIAYSATNRDDMKCCPKIEDLALRQELNLKDDSQLQTDHNFAKNSPMNGQSFIEDGKTIHISQGIACSSDRKVENTGNLRVVQARNSESICYTGRADSDKKALEQASFLFLNELRTSGKGITKTTDVNGNVIYELNYVANSLLSTPWLWSGKSAIAPFPEREYVEKERAAFLKLKQSGPISIEDPNCSGRTFKVKFNPILFSRSLNVWNRLEKWLPPFFTGMSHSQQISNEGYAELELLALKSAAAAGEQKAQAIRATLNTLKIHQDYHNLRPEQELLARDYLCKLIGIPLIYHCKSSTDRTSITNAMSSTLHQWLELKLPIPENICSLIDDYRFKELFAANWMAGHQITRYARGGEGTVCEETLNDKNLGLVLSRGASQNPAIAHLLPERYLTEFPTASKIKTSALYFLLLVPITLFLYIPLFAITTVRHLAWAATLGKYPELIGPGSFILPTLPATLLFNFGSIFPDKVLNESSPQIGDRLIIAGGKHGGLKDDK